MKQPSHNTLQQIKHLLARKIQFSAPLDDNSPYFAEIIAKLITRPGTTIDTLRKFEIVLNLGFIRNPKKFARANEKEKGRENYIDQVFPGII